jgi:hypothetical protein
MNTCKLDWCNGISRAKGYCTAHYQRFKKSVSLNTPVRKVGDIRECSTLECNKKHFGGGLCKSHYDKKRREETNSKERLVRKERWDLIVSCLGGKCYFCKEIFDTSVYDLHHLDPVNKKHTISQIIRGSLEKVMREVEKCILFCSNCHRIKEHQKSHEEIFSCGAIELFRANEFRRIRSDVNECSVDGCFDNYYAKTLCARHYSRSKYKVLWEKVIDRLGGRCQDCGWSYSSYVYDCHHRDPKSKVNAIGTLITNGSFDKIMDETSKTDLLCSNCHRLRHTNEGVEQWQL